MPGRHRRSHDGALTDNVHSGPLVAGPGFPRVALGSAWVCSSLATGAIGWLATSTARWVPLGLAPLGLVATAAVVSNKLRPVTLAFSTVASGVFVVGSVVTGVVLAGPGGALALLAVVPFLGGLATWRLTDRARSMSR